MLARVLVSAGMRGSLVLLVHGFPESWWAFHKLIPFRTARHRVVAVDLRNSVVQAPPTVNATAPLRPRICVSRTYAHPNGRRSAESVYRSMLSEGAEIKGLATARPLSDARPQGRRRRRHVHTGTVVRVAAGDVASVNLEGVGHYAAIEATEALSTAILDFLDDVEGAVVAR